MKQDTVVVTAGRHPDEQHGVVNPPVYHASTVTFPTLDALETASATPYEGVYYGRYGTPTSFAFEEAVAALEGGFGAVSVPSGLSAIATALLAFLKAGDHLLVTDSVYFPTRKFCLQVLAQYGIETTFYDPMIGGGIAELIRDDTRVVFVEAPGSLTFEVQDIPAIAAAAHERGCLVVMDNTWATPLFCKPFALGADVAVHAATKYMVGHSDAMLGVIDCSEATWRPVKDTAVKFGVCAGPDDVYLGQRGLRSMGARLRQHQDTGLALAHWLKDRPEVASVLHPALPDCPGHANWRRDFTGASGLFGVVLVHPYPRHALAAMLDRMELFAMGYSWGGYESLILPTHPEKIRTAAAWRAPGPTLRLHAGLEDPDDLIADLEQGFARLNKAAA